MGPNQTTKLTHLTRYYTMLVYGKLKTQIFDLIFGVWMSSWPHNMASLHMKTYEHIQWCVGGSHGCELFYQFLHFISKILQKYDCVIM